MPNANSKICILHDTFLYKGGGERLILTMAKILDADLAAGFFSSGSFEPREQGFNGKLIAVSSPLFTKGLRHLKLKWAFLFNTKFLAKYDTVLFSGDCIEAVRNIRKDAKAFYYCHTPPRYLFDQKNVYANKLHKYVRPVFYAVAKILAWWYMYNLKKFRAIFTNSKNTQERLKAFTGFDSTVIYPSVDTQKFVPLNTRGDYYFSFARLSSIKRVDLVVQAFLQMPEKNLVFTYGKNDPEKEKILRMTENAQNIHAIESPDDTEFLELLGNAIATIYIPVDEDFGMSPVESMACGIPVIGVNDGWLKETIVDNATGFLLPANVRMEDIVTAVRSMSAEYADTMRETCIKRAKDFSNEVLTEQLLLHMK